MTEPDFLHDEDTDEQPRSPLLTPGSAAIAGFTFAVFSVLGQGAWGTALSTLFWGRSYAMGSSIHVLTAWGVGNLIMAGLAVSLGRRTIAAEADGWASHLARAAVIVAGLGAILAVITIIGGLVES